MTSAVRLHVALTITVTTEDDVDERASAVMRAQEQAEAVLAQIDGSHSVLRHVEQVEVSTGNITVIDVTA